MALRVPVAAYDTLVAEVKALVSPKEIASFSENARDVTSQYVYVFDCASHLVITCPMVA